MAFQDHASNCIADLTTKVQGVEGFEQKTFYVYDYLTMIDTTQELNFPCVGVAYEGMTAKEESKGGLGTYLTCGVFLLVGDKDAEIKGYEKKEDAILLLDRVRNAIKLTQSPTKHKWEFDMEIPFDISKRGLGYYQRWKTTVILT